MTDEEEVEDAEDDGYVPNPELVYEESCLILDPYEFAETYDALAVQMKDGAMFVLGRDHRWRNVEEWGQSGKPGSRLKSVQ